MRTYRAPIDDMKFQLGAFGYDEAAVLERFTAYDLDTLAMLLRQAGTFAEEVLLPTNPVGDRQGLRWDPETGAVTTPDGFKGAYAKLVENGFLGIGGSPDFGGGGAPAVLNTFLCELWIAGNKSLSMISGLAHALTEALTAHGSDALKNAYLPKLVSGEWAATMCLTEPQCGTDLGMLRTRAEPFGDHYKLNGTKIWITFGEHDLTENILHLVLARLPDAPPGIKGISAFLVPKITLTGDRNPVRCTGLEHKMGIHGSPTCVIELDGAEGWLVGEPHRGMRSMFVMMNGARLLVGIEGIALGDIAYQTALGFARERRQGRALDPAKQDKSQPADNILVHPDVRRMLLLSKSTTEAMRGLVTWLSVLLDLSHHHPDATRRETADDLVALLTPVVKSYCSERGFFNVSESMQVCGGTGYTRDGVIEQYLRDLRIAMIYEGTNHVQALDLVGRKLPRDGGRPFQRFAAEVAARVEACKGDDRLASFARETEAAMTTLTEQSMALGARAMADPEEAGAAASNYLKLFGLVALAYSWLRQLEHAVQSPGAQADNKLKTARFYFDHVLPEADALVRILRAGKASTMALGPDDL
jgi:3-(methylsulfanyl)propanoyl-CoA dehydrogenase